METSEAQNQPVNGGAEEARDPQPSALVFPAVTNTLKPYLSLFPLSSDGKASAYHAGDQGSIPESGRSSGEGNGTPLQYSCVENPMDEGAW